MDTTRPWLARGLFGLGLATLFSLVLAAGLCRNDFPSAWHNDEPGKIQQVRQGTRNLHHPPLMLELVAALAEVTGAKPQAEAVAQLGRGFSAVCLATAAVGLALLGARLAGPIAGLLAGAALGSHPLLVECAHYFKEDALHLLGVVAALLAGQLFWENARSRPRAVFLGLALALCVASKHSGWLWLPVMAGVSGWLVWRVHCSHVRPRTCPELDAKPAWKLALGAFIIAYALFCWPMLYQLPMAVGELLWELCKLGGGDYGDGLKTPHNLYLWFIYNDYGWTGSLILATLLLTGLVGLARARPARDWAVHVLAAHSLVYLVGLAFTAKYSDRYGLPLIVAASLALGLAAARFGPWLAGIFHKGPPRGFLVRRLIPATGLVIILALYAPERVHDLRQRLGGFASDSHEDLARFIRNHTPPGSIVAADSKALGPHAAVGARRAVLSSWFAADLGSLEELAARGVRYVAFSRDVAHRYYETDWSRTIYNSPSPETRPLDQHRVNFYSTLRQASPEPRETAAPLQTRLVWTAPYRDPRPLHPGLYLVELIPSSDSESGKLITGQ